MKGSVQTFHGRDRDGVDPSEFGCLGHSALSLVRYQTEGIVLSYQVFRELIWISGRSGGKSRTMARDVIRTSNCFQVWSPS